MTVKVHKRKICVEAFSRKTPTSQYPKFFFNKAKQKLLESREQSFRRKKTLQNKHELLRVARRAEPFEKLQRSRAGTVPACAPSVGLSLRSESGFLLWPQPK